MPSGTPHSRIIGVVRWTLCVALPLGEIPYREN